MNKKYELEKLDEFKTNIEIADELCKKIDPLLPTDWRSYMSDFNTLMFTGNKGGKNAFKKVCSLLTQATGKEVYRKIDLLYKSEKSAYLWGSLYYDPIRICIDQNDITGCNITITKKRKTTYEISGDCLGNKKEE